MVIRETKITKNGSCAQCGDSIERQPRISNEKFAELQQAFFSKSLIRSDIFLQSSPKELSAFRDFLCRHQSRPFTVAFDGLNIACATAHSDSHKVKNQLVSGSHVLSVSESMHFQFAVLRCGIVFPLQFVISTVIPLSDVHSTRIYLVVLYRHNCYHIYSLTL